MLIDFDKETEGVLVICSKIGLMNFFADKEFDYSFPEGILPLVNRGIVVALVTESCDEVKGKIMDEAMNEY